MTCGFPNKAQLGLLLVIFTVGLWTSSVMDTTTVPADPKKLRSDQQRPTKHRSIAPPPAAAAGTSALSAAPPLTSSLPLPPCPTTPTPPPDHRLEATKARDACPVLHPIDHGLVNTGRPALVVYVVTSQADKQARQIEIDNVRFFKGRGMFPPDVPTALFSAIDYAIVTVNLGRNVTGPHGILECSSAANVRVFEAPSGPCDLCAEARIIDALGGPGHVARMYEYIVALNSGARGPFFTEASAAPRRRSPVTWIDHLALGGEKVYTGAVMTGTDGIQDGNRPFLFSFALGLPTSLLTALYPVLRAGCSESPVSPLWQDFQRSYVISFHDPATDRLTGAEARVVLQHALKNTHMSKPLGARTAEEKQFDAQVAGGMHHWRSSTTRVDRSLAKGGERVPAITDRKFRCVVRSEMQLLMSVLAAPLPPEDGTNATSAAAGGNGGAVPTGALTDASAKASAPLRRPNLTAAQRALLSPALSGYLHEGHYFGHVLKHNRTLVNMGHSAVVLHRTIPDLEKHGLFTVPPCRVMFAKFGGEGGRQGLVPAAVIEEIQALSLAHPPRHHAPSTAALSSALRCRDPRPVENMTTS